MMNEKGEYQEGMARHHSSELEQRNRLPTLMEVLGRRTLAPVDLFSFYIYMRDQQRSVDYLDFWLDVSQHMSLCRHYVRELRRSVLMDTPDLDKATSKRSSRLIDNLNLNDTASLSSRQEKLSQEQTVSQILRDGRPDSRGRELQNTMQSGPGYTTATGTNMDRNGLLINSAGNTTTIVGPTTTTTTTTVMHPHHGAITTTRTGYSPDVGSDSYSPANSMTGSLASRRPIHYDGVTPLPIPQNTAHDATTLSKLNLNTFAHHTEDRSIDPATGLPIVGAVTTHHTDGSGSPYGTTRFREADLGSAGPGPMSRGRSIDMMNEKPPRPSFMNTSAHDSSSPGHTVARPDLKASAERILYTFILPGSEREIVLPHAMIERMIHAIEDEGRDDPEVFDDAKDYVFQAMERDAFPGFLQAKAFGNLVPLSVLLRLILGLLILFGGLWGAFFCILRHKGRGTRCFTIIPFIISIYLLITYQYKLDIIMAYAGYSEYTWMNWSKIREPYVKKLLMKRAMIALLLFALITAAVCVLFIFVPGTYF